jgi:hypothetical protein
MIQGKGLIVVMVREPEDGAVGEALVGTIHVVPGLANILCLIRC